MENKKDLKNDELENVNGGIPGYLLNDIEGGSLLSRYLEYVNLVDPQTAVLHQDYLFYNRPADWVFGELINVCKDNNGFSFRVKVKDFYFLGEDFYHVNQEITVYTYQGTKIYTK